MRSLSIFVVLATLLSAACATSGGVPRPFPGAPVASAPARPGAPDSSPSAPDGATGDKPVAPVAPIAPVAPPVIRGILAMIGSGLGFYFISGIWRPFNPQGWDYAVHFLSWTIAFLPGFLALLARRTQSHT